MSLFKNDTKSNLYIGSKFKLYDKMKFVYISIALESVLFVSLVSVLEIKDAEFTQLSRNISFGFASF